MSDTPKRGLLTFSIRDLFWLTALVAVVLWAKYSSRDRYLLQYDPYYGEAQVFDKASGEWWKKVGNTGQWVGVASPVSSAPVRGPHKISK